MQKILWKLANYDAFIMGFCPTMYNNVAGLGVYFIFQILIVFISTCIAFSEFISLRIDLMFIIAILVTLIFYKWMKYFNGINHKMTEIYRFRFQFIFHFIMSFVWAVPYCLALFHYQILFNLCLKTGKVNVGGIEQIWLKPYGLFESCIDENGPNNVFFICLSITILISFIFNAPYILIFKNKNTYYSQFKNNYERNFK